MKNENSNIIVTDPPDHSRAGKTKKQLMDELVELRRQIAKLEALETERKRAEEELRESEDRYRSLVESSEDPIYLIDRNLCYTFANKKFLTRLGKLPDEVLGKEYKEFHSPERTEEFSKIVEKVFQTGNPVFYEHESHRDGRFFLRTLSPVMDSQTGTVESVTVISKDITERKLAEDMLRESEEKYRTIFENVSDQIIYLNKYGKIISANDREKTFGRKPEEIVGKHFTKLGFFDAKDIPKMLKLFKDVITGKRTIKMMEMEVRHKDGHKIPIEVSTNIIKKNGKIEGFLCLVRDITERKRAEEALRESEENFRNIFQSVPESLLAVSNQMEVLNSNEAFSELIRQYAPTLNVSEDELRERILSGLRQHLGRTRHGIIEIGKNPVRGDS